MKLEGINELQANDLLPYQLFKDMNVNFDMEHGITDFEYDKANIIRMTFPLRTGKESKPQTLDILRYADEIGDYYKNALIDHIFEDENRISVCQVPYVPFVVCDQIYNEFEKNDHKRGYYPISISMSGGPFESIHLDDNELICIGTENIEVKDWGKCGGCGNGAFYVPVRVNVWTLKKEVNKYHPYSTKEFDKFYVHFFKEDDNRRNPNNLYAIIDSYSREKEFKTELDYLSWLDTFCGKEVAEEGNRKVVFCYKRKDTNLEPEIFDDLNQDNFISYLFDKDIPYKYNFINDTERINGKIYAVKRLYVHDLKLVTTFFCLCDYELSREESDKKYLANSSYEFHYYRSKYEMEKLQKKNKEKAEYSKPLL